MAVQAGNRVRATSTTTGTGTYTLGAAPSGFQAFSAIADGTQVGYLALLGADWEVGLGTVGSSGVTLSRQTILQSSNSGAAVNWGIGTKEIAHVVPSEILAALTYVSGLRNADLTGTLKVAGIATLQGGFNVGGSIGGTADAITAVLTPAITAYGAQMAVTLTPASANTGAATLALNGLTARSIVKMGATTLVAGDLASGVPAHLIYDLANTRWILLNPQAVWPLTLGGTGASTAAGARTALGLGTASVEADTKYAHRANNLSDLASASTARTNLGLGTAAVEADTKYAHRANNLSDLASASTARSNLGLGSLATASTINDSNWSGTDLAVANGGTGASDAATARSNLGLESMATQASSNVSISGGAISGITDLAVADGGTGASTAADARTNLELGTWATKNQTVSTSDPSGTPADGDTWLKYVP